MQGSLHEVGLGWIVPLLVSPKRRPMVLMLPMEPRINLPLDQLFMFLRARAIGCVAAEHGHVFQEMAISRTGLPGGKRGWVFGSILCEGCWHSHEYLDGGPHAPFPWPRPWERYALVGAKYPE